ncbi:MAG TPA: phospholipase D family protein [Anaeromyxobacteraceae bacterium]|nr:phospholipase D family protein [Anaeromyxobacteraceae bacterium]
MPEPTVGQATRLALAIAPHAAAHPGESGIHALPGPGDAFAARATLAAAADRTLDVQYYIWHGDETGTLLLEALWRAAERGVRVRLLLDDSGTTGLDATLAALDAHPRIEVRLYNPLFHRGFRPLNYLTAFRRVNRRMHNKSLTADGLVAIVGGRNVGNEYFAAGSGTVFADLDLIATGAVVGDVSGAFDRYWNSPSAYPAARLLRPAPPDAAASLEARFRQVRAAPGAGGYLAAVRESATVRDLLAGQLPLEWTTALLLCDDPAKTLDTTGRKDVLLLTAMLQAVGHPEASFDLVSPYLVPGEKGTATITSLARSGVKVRILTNSLAATDVSVVHAGYSKRRRDLLDGGARLFELEPSAAQAKIAKRYWLSGSSHASLHAKTFAVDRARIFVGSFNFDERSAFLNTEMGLLVDSRTLAGRLSTIFDGGFPGAAYEVRRAPGGSLEWLDRDPPGERRLTVEPGTGFLERAWVRFLSILPIDWML